VQSEEETTVKQQNVSSLIDMLYITVQEEWILQSYLTNFEVSPQLPSGMTLEALGAIRTSSGELSQAVARLS